MSFIWLVVCLPSVIFAQRSYYGLLQTCGVQYIKPGSSFQVPCKSDRSATTTIFTPQEELPSHEELEAYGKTVLAGRPERTSTIYEYYNATQGVHDGYYTCVIMHGPTHDPVYSSDSCLIVIKDLCEDSECKDNQICEPDYTKGTVECTCNYNCPQNFNVVCSDTCEMFWHECAMREKECKDGVKRNVETIGFCPTRQNPEVRGVNVDIEAELGEQVSLTSGLIKDGTPAATIEWMFHPENGSPTKLSAREKYEFTASENSVGVYRITLTQCMEGDNAVVNEYRFGIKEVVTTKPPVVTTQALTTTDLNLPGQLTTPGYTCSILPGGVIDDFNARAHFYDLSCTHILAADLLPGGSFLDPWFVYGIFDNHDGKTALMTMTFYLGRKIFEVQRGWVVHTGDGTKVALEEGVEKVVGDTDCTVKFVDLHLEVQCVHFEAYYDGLMSGHIRLKGVHTNGNIHQGRGNLGLCFDNNSGWRPNWQVGNMKGACRVNAAEAPCGSALPADCQLSQPPQIFGKEWTTCGMGAETACHELNCDGATATPAQKCALQQATRVNCNLKIGKPVSGVDLACPDERCDWMKDVVSKGCPQDNLPFDC